MVILLRCTGTLATNYTIMSVCTGEAQWEPDVSQVVQECKNKMSQPSLSDDNYSLYLIVVTVPLAVAILFLFMLVIILLVVTALKVNQRRGK